MEKTPEPGPLVASASPKLKGITVDKSVEFTFEELAVATDNFSMSHKIGQGGFGSVYYGELRGEVCALVCTFVLFCIVSHLILLLHRMHLCKKIRSFASSLSFHDSWSFVLHMVINGNLVRQHVIGPGSCGLGLKTCFHRVDQGENRYMD